MFVNLTPHALNIHHPCGVLSLPPSGEVARVATVEVDAAPVATVEPWLDGSRGGSTVVIPTVMTTYGEVTGLPDPVKGVTLIVSGMVASASPRGDVMSPGPLVRDEGGRPIGCRGLRRSLTN